MATYTTNYGWTKPSYEDAADIEVINGTIDNIDAQVKTVENAIPTTLAELSGDSTHRTVTDTEKSTWNSKQNAIDSSHKLSADLVDDTNATNKFATAEELEQIETNKNNILLLTANGGGKNYFNPQSVTYEPSDANITYSLSGDTITLSVTTLSNVSEFNIKGINFPLNKDLVLTGCPANTGYTIRIDAFNNSTYISGSSDTGSGSQPFRFTTMTNSRLRIRIGANTSFTNLQFKIMVRDSNTDSTYQPYAMSNAELTAAIQALQAQLANQ